MTLDQLRVFVAVAERQHVTRAAEHLHMTQSATSAAIAALEFRHKTKLFHRVGRGIELTEAGSAFLVQARAVIGQMETAELVLAELGELKRGTLLVQASKTIASYWLPRHLVAYNSAYPGIDIRLTIGNTAQVASAVLAGAAELGFVEGNGEILALTNHVVARDQMVIVVAPGHTWAEQDRVSAATLTQSDWVMREPGSGTRSVFEHALRAHGLSLQQLRVPIELPSNEAVRAAVEAGLGATALSATVVAPSLEAGLLRRVHLDLPERAFQVVHHTERHLSRAASALLRMVMPISTGSVQASGSRS